MLGCSGRRTVRRRESVGSFVTNGRSSINILSFPKNSENEQVQANSTLSGRAPVTVKTVEAPEIFPPAANEFRDSLPTVADAMLGTAKCTQAQHSGTMNSTGTTVKVRTP
jgi:hypothetical protein